MRPTPLWAEQRDLPAAVPPGVNNSPLSYQLRSRRAPADTALQSAAVPLSQVFLAFTPLALSPSLTLQPVWGENHNIPHSALI